jgi:hypothetical protein
MRPITKRLARLEIVAESVDHGLTIAESILAARRRRGVPYEPRLSLDNTGCRTIADAILRARTARMEYQLRQSQGRND